MFITLSEVMAALSPEGFRYPHNMGQTKQRNMDNTTEHNGLLYGEMVQQLIKHPSSILIQLTEEKIGLVHSAMGVAGEAGELVDAVKKHAIYNKELDKENVIEELGDLEFYMEDLRQRLGLTREQCLKANMRKLAKRYEGFGYTDQRAHDRADKT